MERAGKMIHAQELGQVWLYASVCVVRVKRFRSFPLETQTTRENWGEAS